MNDGMLVDVVDGSHDAILKFLFRRDAKHPVTTTITGLKAAYHRADKAIEHIVNLLAAA